MGIANFDHYFSELCMYLNLLKIDILKQSSQFHNSNRGVSLVNLITTCIDNFSQIAFKLNLKGPIFLKRFPHTP